MIFGEKIKSERKRRGWSQEELAEKLYVSRQSVSKWENGQHYPSIETIIKTSDLFGITIDELLRSDEELTKKVISDSKQLKYPNWKAACDILFVLGGLMLAVKLVVLAVNYFADLELTLYGGRLLWNIGPLVLMIGAGVAADALKKIYKND